MWLDCAVRFCLLAAAHPVKDSVRHTAGRPDDAWAEANSFFGHDNKHKAMARQEIKNSQGKHLSFHSAAYRKTFFFEPETRTTWLVQVFTLMLRWLAEQLQSHLVSWVLMWLKKVPRCNFIFILTIWFNLGCVLPWVEAQSAPTDDNARLNKQSSFLWHTSSRANLA